MSRSFPFAAAPSRRFDAGPPYRVTIDAFRRGCPAYIPEARWRQAIADAEAFLDLWGREAVALGWTPAELFGLHKPPDNPRSNYNRLSRYDRTDLIWLLPGRPVVALTAETAIQTRSGGILTYRKERKPALGPVGDSLDDFVA